MRDERRTVLVPMTDMFFGAGGRLLAARIRHSRRRGGPGCQEMYPASTPVFYTARAAKRKFAKCVNSEFQCGFGRLRGVAHREAVIVTSHGRDDVVLVSAGEYRRLRSLDRRAMHVSELSREEIAALDKVEIPAEGARYNHEMS
jgi:prevent-host-death family protein